MARTRERPPGGLREPGLKLSICIPTYNFALYIEETLRSITSQLRPGVEVIILDGGSTDNTSDVVQPFLDVWPLIRYVRQAERGGIDRDMARVMDLARGDYCWLFSADDVMTPGALELVLGALDSEDDLYLCTMTICDLQLNVMHDHPVSRAAPGELFDLQKREDRRRYFRLAETTTALFSFMGSLILRRERWNEQPLEENYVGSLWAHVVRICRMMPRGMRLRYLGRSLLYKRSGNDSFMEKGLVHRYAMAIDGYHRIAAEVFGSNSFEARHMRRVLANEFPPIVFFDMQDRSATAERAEIDRLASKAYGDFTLANLAWLLEYRFYRQTRRAASRIKRFTRRLAGLRV